MNLCVESSVCYDFAQEVSFLIKNHNSVLFISDTFAHLFVIGWMIWLLALGHVNGCML